MRSFALAVGEPLRALCVAGCAGLLLQCGSTPQSRHHGAIAGSAGDDSQPAETGGSSAIGGDTSESGGNSNVGGAAGDLHNGGMAGVAGNAAAIQRPLGVGLSASRAGPRIGRSGTAGNNDICPEDQVATGIRFHIDDKNWLYRMQVLCGALVLSESEELRVDTAPGAALTDRGQVAETEILRLCPPGHVLLGIDSHSDNSAIWQVAPLCAPLLVEYKDGTPRVVPGTALRLDGVGDPGGTPATWTGCSGQRLVRGFDILSGLWIDGLTAVCADVQFVYGEGATCTSDMSCASGRCDGTCQPARCQPSEVCSCAHFDGNAYVFCKTEYNFGSAEAHCVERGMHLASVTNRVENGWLRATATWRSITEFWLGGADSAREGAWVWRDGVQFWLQGKSIGIPLSDAYSRWAQGNPDGDENVNCALMLEDENWNDVACGANVGFVCKGE